MNMTNDLDILNCDFAADVVPYIYGEMSPTGSFAFESHLLDCDECTDALAGVSFARYEVYDWKKLEFDPLPTPRMLPFGDPAQVPEKASWFDELRGAFSGWLVPGSAFAAITLAVVYGVTSYSDTPIVNTVSQVEGPTVISEPNPSPPVQIPTPSSPAREVRKPESEPVKVVARENLTQRRSVRTPRTTSARPTPAVAKTAPRLNEFPDDEDTSLRLAILFEDLDTRD